jgi:ABC-2 type transport system ATP-binding protein
MLCGLLTPSSGEATVAGHVVAARSSSRDLAQLRTSIGYMSQKFSLYVDLSVEDNLAFFGGAYGLWGRSLAMRMDELVARVDLAEVRRTATHELPGGMRQRVALAASLLHKPKIVFLDEPTAGVDPSSRRAFWRLIRELAREGTTVFVTTHHMDEAENCARIGLMVAGKLVALDTPTNLKRTWVPGRTLTVHPPDLSSPSISSDLRPTIEGLREREGVFAVEPFGASLHVRIDPMKMSEEGLRSLLPAGATLEPIEPTLEDVFLAVVASP